MSASTWTWTGASGTEWANSGDWNPSTGSPQPGDTAILNSATPPRMLTVTGTQLSDNTIDLSNGATVNFANGSTLDAGSAIYGGVGTIAVAGSFLDYGTIQTTGSTAVLTVLIDGTLTSNGLPNDAGINAGSAGSQTNNGTLVVNGGAIEDEGIHVNDGVAVVTTALDSSDEVSITGGSVTLDLMASGAPLLQFVSASIASTLKLVDPTAYADGSIGGFSTGDTLDIGSNVVGTIVYDNESSSGYNNITIEAADGSTILSAVMTGSGANDIASGTYTFAASGGTAGGFQVTQGTGDTLISLAGSTTSPPPGPSTWSWIGTTGSYDVSSNWTLVAGTSTTGYPVNGDSAFIPAGTVDVSGATLDLENLNIGGTSSAGIVATDGGSLEVNSGLLMLNASTLTLDNTSAIDLGTSGSYVAGAVDIESGISLVGNGLLGVASVIDDGEIIVSNSASPGASTGGTLEIAGGVSGAGGFSLTSGSALLLDGTVDTGLSIAFSAGSSDVLVLATPGTAFANAITGLATGDRIEFGNGMTVTAASVVNGNTIAVDFHGTNGLSGTYDLSDVGFAADSGQQLNVGVDATTADSYIQVGTATTQTATQIGPDIWQAGSNYVIGTSLASGVTLEFQGSPVTSGQFGTAVVPIAAAPLAGGGYEVAWEVTGANEYTVWDTNAGGNYVGSPIGVVPGGSFALEQLEISFNDDLNGDGTIGPVGTSLGSDIWQFGSNYVIGTSLDSGTLLEFQGSPVTVEQFGTAVVPIAAAPLAGGGYEVAWEVLDANEYTVWDTDADGNYTSSPIGIVSGTSPLLEEFELSVGQDLNNDDTIGVVPTQIIGNPGSFDLLQVGDDYVLGSNSGTIASFGTAAVSPWSGPILQYQGSPVTAGEFGANVVPIAAAPLAGGGYEVAWEVMGANEYTVWDVNANGNYVGSPVGVVSGSNLALEALEPSFNDDLNGDGTIGVVPMSVVQVDNGVTLGATGNDYVMEASTGGAVLSYQGNPVTAGQFGTNVVPIGAAPLAGGGYEVAWEVTGANEYTVWDTDANGNYVGTPIGVVAGNSPLLEALEPSFGQDLNNDGTIGLVPTQIIGNSGTFNLLQIGNDYVLGSNSGTIASVGTVPVSPWSGPVLQYQGNPVTAGEFGADVVPIAAAPLASGGYEVAWEVMGANEYTVWDVNANGNYVSSPIGVVSGTNLALEALEPSFNDDLNGDGTIGVASASVIQVDNGMTLASAGNEYVMEGSAGGAVLQYQGNPVTAGEFGANVVPIGAAALAGGGFEVAWEVMGANEYTVWDTDASGNYVGSPIGVVSGTSLALEVLEPSFNQDLNNDGTIGVASATAIQVDNGTTLAAAGNEYVMEGSAGGAVLQYQGNPVTAGEFGADVVPIGAVKTAGGYDVAWEVNGSNEFIVWSTDNNGNYTGSPTGVVPGQSFALEDLEPTFGQDLNGDGRLSSELVTATGAGGVLNLSDQTQAATINLGGNGASAIAALNAVSLSFIGTPDAITLGSGADTIEYALTPGSGIETIANFTYGLDELNIDLAGAASSTLQAYNTMVNGVSAIAITSSADASHGVVLLNMTSGQTAATLLDSHTTFIGGHALIS